MKDHKNFDIKEQNLEVRHPYRKKNFPRTNLPNPNLPLNFSVSLSNGKFVFPQLTANQSSHSPILPHPNLTEIPSIIFLKEIFR